MRYCCVLALLFSPSFSLAAEGNYVRGDDLLNSMQPAEWEYYNRNFAYIMETGKPGKTYRWMTYGASGAITPGHSFESASKSHCRMFSEDFTVQEKKGVHQGAACKRSDGTGWCKVNPQEMMSCALQPRNQIERLTDDAAGIVNDGANTLGRISRGITGK